MRRRALLTLAGTTIAGLAGCAGEDGPTTTEPDAPEPSTAPAATATGNSTPVDSTTSTARATTPEPTTTTEPWPSEPYADYETTTVRVLSPEGERRGAVTAAVADNKNKRLLGLSDAESMPEGGGLLFVYDSVADRPFVMRRMDFGLDIVYADGEGTITSIHHAPAPGPNEDGNEQRYSGTGQYVFELNYGWTDRHGVAVGDRLAFEL